jgi:hypothetical protein
VALVSVHTAAGRAMAADAIEVELCTTGGVTVLLLGSDGRPVERHVACPDCIMGGLAGLPAAAHPLQAPGRLGDRIGRPVNGVAVASRSRPATCARDPPPTV